MYAVTRDGKSARAIASEAECAVGEVAYDGELPILDDGSLALVWDDTAEGMRPFTPEEWEQAYRMARKRRVDELRFVHEQSGFKGPGGKIYQSDQESFNRILGATIGAQVSMALSQPFTPIAWKAADNSVITLDAIGVIGLFSALLAHGKAMHEYTQSLKAKIDAGEEVDIETGWPQPQ